MGNGPAYDRKKYARLLLPIVVAIVVVGLLTKGSAAGWVINLLLMAAFLAVAGVVVVGLPRGALVDERKKVSLSRLQTALWTVVVLSAFLTAALANVASGASDPLAIAVPTQLWVVMGISTASLIGSPLIKGQKMQAKPTTAAAKKEKTALGACAHGVIATNENASDSTWGNLFQGEELTNYTSLDLGKVQMFLFTVVLVVAYVAALWEMFKSSSGAIRELPDVAAGMNVLLGISHTAYLSYKAIPRD